MKTVEHQICATCKGVGIRTLYDKSEATPVPRHHLRCSDCEGRGYRHVIVEVDDHEEDGG